jgi:uncharacterized protein (TIRG00374 family)
MVFILLLSMAAIALPPEYRSISYIIAIATISLFISLYMILHYKDKLGKIGRRAMRGRWPGLYITLKKFSYSFTRGIEMLRSSQYFLGTLVLSLASWGAHVTAIYYLFKSFGLDLPLASAVALMLINTLALMIPITPGNAGTFELAVAASLMAYRVGKADAVLFALALHILDLLPIITMGMFFFRSERMTIKEIREEGEKEEFLGQVDAPELASGRDPL